MVADVRCPIRLVWLSRLRQQTSPFSARYCSAMASRICLRASRRSPRLRALGEEFGFAGVDLGAVLGAFKIAQLRCQLVDAPLSGVSWVFPNDGRPRFAGRDRNERKGPDHDEQNEEHDGACAIGPTDGCEAMLWDSAAPGLGLRAGPDGRRTWIVHRRCDGSVVKSGRAVRSTR